MNSGKSRARAFADDARLFVIRLAGEKGEVLGYAVAERLSFLDPEAAAGNFPGFGAGANLEDAFKALAAAQRAEGVTADAAALPATLDPGGRGLTIGAPSATRGAPSSAASPAGAASAESVRGAPSSPPAAESTRGAPSSPPDDNK